jgi:hypothetical protein
MQTYYTEHLMRSSDGEEKVLAYNRPQELMIAAVLSGDPVMLQTFRAPKLIPDENGVLVDNADADMHTLTAVQSFAKVFTDAAGILIPKTRWVKQSKDESLISLPGTPRDYGKKVVVLSTL